MCNDSPGMPVRPDSTPSATLTSRTAPSATSSRPSPRKPGRIASQSAPLPSICRLAVAVPSMFCGVDGRTERKNSESRKSATCACTEKRGDSVSKAYWPRPVKVPPNACSFTSVNRATRSAIEDVISKSPNSTSATVPRSTSRRPVCRNPASCCQTWPLAWAACKVVASASSCRSASRSSGAVIAYSARNGADRSTRTVPSSDDSPICTALRCRSIAGAASKPKRPSAVTRNGSAPILNSRTSKAAGVHPARTDRCKGWSAALESTSPNRSVLAAASTVPVNANSSSVPAAVTAASSGPSTAKSWGTSSRSAACPSTRSPATGPSDICTSISGSSGGSVSPTAIGPRLPVSRRLGVSAPKMGARRSTSENRSLSMRPDTPTSRLTGPTSSSSGASAGGTERAKPGRARSRPAGSSARSSRLPSSGTGASVAPSTPSGPARRSTNTFRRSESSAASSFTLTGVSRLTSRARNSIRPTRSSEPACRS